MARRAIIGIYEILNSINGKRYIGSSSNVKKRMAAHKRFLNEGGHFNSYLQYSWDKYGSEHFTFKIIEHCEKEDLLLREQMYLLTYQRNGKWESLYNVAKAG